MKKINFVQTLINEEKISLVEPSKEISESYNQKAENSLRAAKVLLKQRLLEESTSMSYYSMYHKTIALFRLIGIKCENHAVTIMLLKEIFELDNDDISFAKKERVDKQYYTDFNITEDDAKELINKAEKFIEELDSFIDKLTEDKRKSFRNSFEEIYF